MVKRFAVVFIVNIPVISDVGENEEQHEFGFHVHASTVHEAISSIQLSEQFVGVPSDDGKSAVIVPVSSIRAVYIKEEEEKP